MISVQARRATPEEAVMIPGLQRHASGMLIRAIGVSAFAAMPVAGIASLIVLVVTRSETITARVAIPVWIAVTLWIARRVAKKRADEEKPLAEAAEHYRREMTIEVVKVTGIVEATEVLELEDMGPGLLLRTRDNEVVYLAGPVLDEAALDLNSGTDTTELEDPYAAEELVAECWSGTRELLSVRWSGPQVEISGFVDFSELGIKEWMGCYVLASGDGGGDQKARASQEE